MISCRVPGLVLKKERVLILTVILTLNSGRKLSVFSTNNDSDLNEVFHELIKEIRRGDSDIDMWEFQNHMKFYNGVDEGTWYS